MLAATDSRRANRHVQFDTGLLLQVSDHIEEIACLRIAAWPEHPNETFWLGAGRTPEFLEAHRRFDVIAEDRLPGLNVPREKQVNSPAKQGFRKLGIGSNVILNEFLKTSGRYFRPGFSHVTGAIARRTRLAVCRSAG